MPDGSNVQRLPIVIKADPIIPHAQPKLWRIDILEAFYVAFSGGSKIGKGVKDS